MGKAGSQGEGGPGEMELSVANATAAFEMVLSPGAGRTSAAGVQPPSGCRQRPPNRQRWGTPPSGHHSGRANKCRRQFNAGDARGEAPCIK